MMISLHDVQLRRLGRLCALTGTRPNTPVTCKWPPFAGKCTSRGDILLLGPGRGLELKSKIGPRAKGWNNRNSTLPEVTQRGLPRLSRLK